MILDRLREQMKSGPMQGLYAFGRKIKRRLRNEPLSGYAPMHFEPISGGELRALIPALPEYGRFYYALALDILVTEQSSELRKALACLRCAKTLEFESEERLALYTAQIAAMRGDAPTAYRLVSALAPWELTEEESALRSRILDGQMAPAVLDAPLAAWQSLSRLVNESGADSLFVAGDPDAISADWLPDAEYLLSDPQVTGLTVAAAATLGRAFTLGVGSVEAQQRAREVGMRCTRWLDPEHLPGTG